MKKVLSSILVGTMLISSMGAISIFADGTETSFSATAEANPETSSTETELGEAIGKLKENITKLEVKSFWERNKGTILKVTGGVVAAAATAATLYFGYKYLGTNEIFPVNPAGDQIGNPTEDPAANSDQTPTTQVEGIQSKETPVNTDVCLPEEENICLPVDKDIINTADVSANSHDAGSSISTNQNLFANSTESPTKGQTGDPTGEQAVVTPENQMSCDIASKEAEAALEDLKNAYLERLKNPIDPMAKNQYQKADERYISASNKVGKCNPIHSSGKEDMCLIDNKDTEADHSSTIPKTETIFCKENAAALEKALKDAGSAVCGGISSTASTVWKAMWHVNADCEELYKKSDAAINDLEKTTGEFLKNPGDISLEKQHQEKYDTYIKASNELTLCQVKSVGSTVATAVKDAGSAAVDTVKAHPVATAAAAVGAGTVGTICLIIKGLANIKLAI
ncbi:MAG: hypothetical protein RUMPE_00001 [Eubacteriales bacterium SKADARSKE-1]|nr:hypothetical protein [Eubacteriales bacterium SKADARSKE-1]